MGGCQHYGPFLGTLYIRCRIILEIQKGTIILTTIHMVRISLFYAVREGFIVGTDPSCTAARVKSISAVDHVLPEFAAQDRVAGVERCMLRAYLIQVAGLQFCGAVEKSNEQSFPLAGCLCKCGGCCYCSLCAFCIFTCGVFATCTHPGLPPCRFGCADAGRHSRPLSRRSRV